MRESADRAFLQPAVVQCVYPPNSYLKSANPLAKSLHATRKRVKWSNALKPSLVACPNYRRVDP
jgi:hypothetical protein